MWSIINARAIYRSINSCSQIYHQCARYLPINCWLQIYHQMEHMRSHWNSRLNHWAVMVWSRTAVLSWGKYCLEHWYITGLESDKIHCCDLEMRSRSSICNPIQGLYKKRQHPKFGRGSFFASYVIAMTRIRQNFSLVTLKIHSCDLKIRSRSSICNPIQGIYKKHQHAKFGRASCFSS